MNDNDYVILFDQNGSPYIAHASFSEMRQRTAGALRAVGDAATNAKKGVGRGVRATHKYIDKVVENGRTRYFYTQEELKAYYNEKKGQVNQKVGEAQEKAAATRMRMQRIGNEFRDKAENTANEAKASAKAYKEYQDANKARDPKRITEAWSELQKHPAAMKAEMSKRKVAEAGEAIENTASKVKDKLNKSSGTKSKDLAEPLPPIIPNDEPKKPNAPKKIEVKDKKALSALRDKLSSTNGTPGNGVDDNGETRSMLGSYAINIPSDPEKLKDWADNGKKQAQKVLDQAEQEYKQIEQDFKDGKYTQQQMWIAQGIIEDLRDEMSEWDYLSAMNPEQLSQLFGPLIKKK